MTTVRPKCSRRTAWFPRRDVLGFISYLVNAFYSVLQRSEDNLWQLIQPERAMFIWLVLME